MSKTFEKSCKGRVKNDFFFKFIGISMHFEIIAIISIHFEIYCNNEHTNDIKQWNVYSHTPNYFNIGILISFNSSSYLKQILIVVDV